ncbi:MAG: hypothetical protein IPO61_05835 [Gammaproteobacteria bacterium]|nr:hypothetical protein [Gammaproteobacteria bacterium]
MNLKKYLLGVVATGVAACLWSAGAAANLVLNGSFEDLNGSSTLSDGYYEALNNGSSRLPNWDVTAIGTRAWISSGKPVLVRRQ